MNDIVEFATYCIVCMQEKGQVSICPQCGYDERSHKLHPLYLKPRTLLRNQYFIGKILGQGGFGITYIALDKWLRKKVAIKEYLPAAFATRDFHTAKLLPLKSQELTFKQGLQLFIDEARHLAKFDHPHIVKVINFFEENQTGYMVMEYLEGNNLVDILQQANGHLSVEQALTLIFPILDALAVIHAQQIYHRDVSLQNIRILTNGVPVLLDFGAARHIVGEQTHTLDLVLTHGYSPLEQYSGKGKIGPWTDIYACGALLYLLISGKLPPAATDRLNEEQLPSLTKIVDLPISPLVNAAIERALAIKPEQRFQTVQAFKAALQGIMFSEAKVYITPIILSPTRRGLTRLFLPWIGLFLSISLAVAYFSEKPEIVIEPSPPLEIVHNPLSDLLAKAQIQWDNGNLTAPPGDNAYETYRQILTLDANNVQAQVGLEKIATYYAQLAKTAQEQGHFKESLIMVQQGLQVLPTHEQLTTLENTLTNILAQQQNQQTQQIKQLLDKASDYFAASQLEDAYATYQQIFALIPKYPPARAGLTKIAEKYEQLARERKQDANSSLFIIEKGLSLFPNHLGLLTLKQELTDTKRVQQRKITELLNQATQQISALQLVEPPGNNAYETYQQILAVAPDNQQAKLGFAKIADVYEKLAKIEQQNKDFDKSITLIEKGLKIAPTHAGLLALNKKVTQQQMRVVPPSTVSRPLPPPLPPTAPRDPIADLLATAKQQVVNNQLEAAAETYRKVLIIEENNSQAQTGLQQIAKSYEQLARDQQQRAQLVESLSLIEKGLRVFPQHAELLALQEEVKRRLAEKNEKIPSTPNILFTPSF